MLMKETGWRFLGINSVYTVHLLRKASEPLAYVTCPLDLLGDLSWPVLSLSAVRDADRFPAFPGGEQKGNHDHDTQVSEPRKHHLACA